VRRGAGVEPRLELVEVDQHLAAHADDCAGFGQAVTGDALASGVEAIGGLEDQVAQRRLRKYRVGFGDLRDGRQAAAGLKVRRGGRLLRGVLHFRLSLRVVTDTDSLPRG
jgi:hypothetical protein